MAADPLREHVLELLRGGHAHVGFDDAVKGFPVESAGVRPPGLPHCAWELLEHMRIAQEDILRFSQSPDWTSPKWPKGYWPETSAPGSHKDWTESVKAFRRDLEEFEKLVKDPAQDLFKPFPWGQGQTLLREALLIADHNSHHLGQFVLVRRALGNWKA